MNDSIDRIIESDSSSSVASGDDSRDATTAPLDYLEQLALATKQSQQSPWAKRRESRIAGGLIPGASSSSLVPRGGVSSGGMSMSKIPKPPSGSPPGSAGVGGGVSSSSLPPSRQQQRQSNALDRKTSVSSLYRTSPPQTAGPSALLDSITAKLKANDKLSVPSSADAGQGGSAGDAQAMQRQRTVAFSAVTSGPSSRRDSIRFERSQIATEGEDSMDSEGDVMSGYDASMRFKSLSMRRKSYLSSYFRHQAMVSGADFKGMSRHEQARHRIVLQQQQRHKLAESEVLRTRQRIQVAHNRRVNAENMRSNQIASIWMTVLAATVIGQKYYENLQRAKAMRILAWRLLPRLYLKAQKLRRRGALKDIERRLNKPDLSILKGDAILKHFPDDQLLGLLEGMRPAFFFEGDVVVYQGSEGSECFIIDSGECTVMVEKKVLKIPDGSEIRMKKGTIFGTPGMVSGEPRMATIRAACNTVLWVGDRRSFMGSFTQGDPRVAQAFKVIDEIHKGNICRLHAKALTPEGLQRFGVFGNVDKVVLKLASEHFIAGHYQPGQVIVQKGQRANTSWLVLHGRVNITIHIPPLQKLQHALFEGLRMLGGVFLARKKPRSYLFERLDAQLRQKFKPSDVAPTHVEVADVPSHCLLGVANLLFGSPYEMTVTAKTSVDCVLIQRDRLMAAMLTDGFALLAARNYVQLSNTEFFPFWYMATQHPASDSIRLTSSQVRLKNTFYSPEWQKRGASSGGGRAANANGGDALSIGADNPDDCFIITRGHLDIDGSGPDDESYGGGNTGSKVVARTNSPSFSSGRAMAEAASGSAALHPFLWPPLVHAYYGFFSGHAKVSTNVVRCHRIRRRDIHKAIHNDLEAPMRDFLLSAIAAVAVMESGSVPPNIAPFAVTTHKKVAPAAPPAGSGGPSHSLLLNSVDLSTAGPVAAGNVPRGSLSPTRMQPPPSAGGSVTHNNPPMVIAPITSEKRTDSFVLHRHSSKGSLTSAGQQGGPPTALEGAGMAASRTASMLVSAANSDSKRRVSFHSRDPAQGQGGESGSGGVVEASGADFASGQGSASAFQKSTSGANRRMSVEGLREDLLLTLPDHRKHQLETYYREQGTMAIPQWTPRRKHMYGREHYTLSADGAAGGVDGGANSSSRRRRRQHQQQSDARHGIFPPMARHRSSVHAPFSYGELTELMRDHLPSNSPYTLEKMAEAQHRARKEHRRPQYGHREGGASGSNAPKHPVKSVSMQEAIDDALEQEQRRRSQLQQQQHDTSEQEGSGTDGGSKRTAGSAPRRSPPRGGGGTKGGGRRTNKGGSSEPRTRAKDGGGTAPEDADAAFREALYSSDDPLFFGLSDNQKKSKTAAAAGGGGDGAGHHKARRGSMHPDWIDADADGELRRAKFDFELARANASRAFGEADNDDVELFGSGSGGGVAAVPSASPPASRRGRDGRAPESPSPRNPHYARHMRKEAEQQAKAQAEQQKELTHIQSVLDVVSDPTQSFQGELVPFLAAVTVPQREVLQRCPHPPPSAAAASVMIPLSSETSRRASPPSAHVLQHQKKSSPLDTKSVITSGGPSETKLPLLFLPQHSQYAHAAPRDALLITHDKKGVPFPVSTATSSRGVRSQAEGHSVSKSTTIPTGTLPPPSPRPQSSWRGPASLPSHAVFGVTCVSDFSFLPPDVHTEESTLTRAFRSVEHDDMVRRAQKQSRTVFSARQFAVHPLGVGVGGGRGAETVSGGAGAARTPRAFAVAPPSFGL